MCPARLRIAIRVDVTRSSRWRMAMPVDLVADKALRCRGVQMGTVFLTCDDPAAGRLHREAIKTPARDAGILAVRGDSREERWRSVGRGIETPA